MGDLNNKSGREKIDNRATSSDIARYGVRTARKIVENEECAGRLNFAATDSLMEEDRKKIRRKVIISVISLVVIFYISLGIMGPAKTNGGGYYNVRPYEVLTPIEVTAAIKAQAHNIIGPLTHTADPHSREWLKENARGYWAVPKRAGVISITVICAVLLSISGMLFQNVFKNPIAGPGMLGVSSGVSLGVLLIVMLYGNSALSRIHERYLFCYLFGAIILVFVIIAGRKISGRGKSFNVVTMILIGSILSQLIGGVLSYVTLFVMDPETYEVYLTISRMLIVDTSLLSWVVLGIAAIASIIPIYLLRWKMNALAFDDAEAKLFGLNFTMLRGIALICGSIMILAAQIHVGMVGMVSLIVPFMARSFFGCEFNKQFIGNICLSTIFLLVCRDIADLIPFVGNGIAVGSIVSVVALPLFFVIMARQMRAWE